VTELTAEREREKREEERRSAAKVVLDNYRGPLLDAAWHLGERVDNIRNRAFFTYLSEGSGHEHDAKLTTLFRLANYLGWREFVRIKVQLLRFDNEDDTRLVAGFLNDFTGILSSDKLDERWAMLWGEKQRAIGELMIEQSPAASSIVRGHAAFDRDYEEIFAPWMDSFAQDLFSDAALRSDRLRLLQWALSGLVRKLDEDGTYGTDWIGRSAAEMRQPLPQQSNTKYEERVRKHIAALDNR
jgi:hypothetical protein